MKHSLTLYLALLGGLVLMAVLVHGAWSARRAAAKQPRRLDLEPTAGEGLGGLMGGMGGGMTGDMTQGEPADSSLAPASPGGARAASAVATPAAAGLARRGESRLDGLIDAIATLSLEAPASGDHILLHWPASRRAGSKPFAIEGKRVDDQGWEVPQAGGLYDELQAGLLMANRMGGLNEIEYSEFVQKIQSMADAIGANAEFPDMLDVVSRARELDAFAGAHDAQLAMRLVAKGSAWTLGYVQQQALRQGFVPGALPGRFVLPSAQDGAPPILTLQFDAQAAFAEDPQQASLRELLLCFDVPQTAAEQTPFRSWCEAGASFAASMDASMQDDSGRPFTTAAFSSIEAELARLYDALAQRDLAAGSASTRRLFS